MHRSKKISPKISPDIYSGRLNFRPTSSQPTSQALQGRCRLPISLQPHRLVETEHVLVKTHNDALQDLAVAATRVLYPLLTASTPSHTSLQHLPQHAHQRAILQRGRDALLIGQLLIDLLARTMRAVLDADVDPEARRQGLLEPHAHPEPDDGRQRAVRDGRGDEDGDGAERGGTARVRG